MSEERPQDGVPQPEWHQRGGCAWRWRLNTQDVGIYQCGWCGAIMVGGKREVRVVMEPTHGSERIQSGTTIIA